LNEKSIFSTVLWIRNGFDASPDPVCKVIAELDPDLDPVPDQDQRFDEKSREILQLAKNNYFKITNYNMFIPWPP
jgi:hypothetical protein